jgi:hypothetical protein
MAARLPLVPISTRVLPDWEGAKCACVNTSLVAILLTLRTRERVSCCLLAEVCLELQGTMRMTVHRFSTGK